MNSLTKRRLLLITLAISLLIGDVVWLTIREKAHVDFTLELTQQSVVADYAGKLVHFDGQRRRWRFDGQEILSITPFLRDDDPERMGPDSIGFSAMVGLGGVAKVSDAQQALALLASEGICQFAFFVAATPVRPGRSEEVTVARLLSFRTDADETQRCVDRVNDKRRAEANVR